MNAPIAFQAVRCKVCGLPVRRDCGNLREAPPGPHFPVLDQRTMTAFPGGGDEMFPTCCGGSYLLGSVVMMELASDHEIEGDEPVMLWEQGQSD